jgi:hypothetical protein
MQVSDEFKVRVKLNDEPSYRIAQAAKLDPSVLSKLLHGITRIKPMDQRVIKVGKILGLSPQECFKKTGHQSNMHTESLAG